MSTVPTVAVGSANPVKVRAVERIVRHWHADAVVHGVTVPSGVPDQPWGDDETIRGARARAIAARERLDADVGVGIEGGVVDVGEELRTCAWAVVALRDGRTFLGGSLSLSLPAAVAALVRGGTELGHAMDTVTGASGTKHGAGAVGILTDGLVDRQQAYETIVAYAFAPLLVPDHYGVAIDAELSPAPATERAT
ncbi:MAG: inosine/xanthosine triphosphatase [Gemmatimonadaceae bacterium]|nr:inosine/xanthosine triphosphatase [Gemmatimonadaceae bacterium]